MKLSTSAIVVSPSGSTENDTVQTRRNTLKADAHGFTLIELLVVIAIIAIVPVYDWRDRKH